MIVCDMMVCRDVVMVVMAMIVCWWCQACSVDMYYLPIRILMSSIGPTFFEPNTAPRKISCTK